MAKLLNGGQEADETLQAVAQTLRQGLPADRVVIWFRDIQTGRFRGVEAPLGPDCVRLQLARGQNRRAEPASGNLRARGGLLGVK